MERAEAIIISLFLFLLFGLLAYYGARLTWWSSLVLTILLILIIFNIFYPPSQATMDDPDYSLALYVILELVGIILLILYILQQTLTDLRC